MKILKSILRKLCACLKFCESTGCHFTPIDSHKWETKIESHMRFAAKQDAIL